MEFGSVLIVIFIFLLSGLYILRPFLVSAATGGRAGSTLRDSLVAERERLLLAIEELDLEFELNKISSDDHTQNREILLFEAAKVIKEIDNLPKTRAEKQKKTAPVRGDENLEKMIAERRKQLKGVVSQKCPHCGEAVDKDGQFCSHCGGAL